MMKYPLRSHRCGLPLLGFALAVATAAVAAPDNAANIGLEDANAAPSNTAPTGAFGPEDVPPLIETDAAPSESTNATQTPAVETPAPEAPVITAPDVLPPNNFAGAPPVPGTRRNLAPDEAPDEYTIEAGDSLHDISDQLLDEPDYWPKLWSLNPEIKNPHFIWPGSRLRFYPGNEETPPYLQVVAEGDTTPVDKGALQESQLVAEETPALEVVDPEEEQVEEEEIPEVEGVPEIAVVGPNEIISDTESFEFIGGLPTIVDLPLTIPAFIFRDEPQSLGAVIGGESGQLQASQGETVLIENRGGLTINQTYLAVRRTGEVETPKDALFVGYRFEFSCTVKITRTLANDGVAVGRADDCLNGVRKDDLIIPYRSVRARGPVDQSLRGLEGADFQVVGFDHPNQTFGSEGSIVFLDGVGLRKGSDLEVIQQMGHYAVAGLSDNLPSSNPRRVATIRVLDVTDDVATAFVIQADQELLLGDSGQ